MTSPCLLFRLHSWFALPKVVGITHRQISCIELNYLLKIQLYQELQNMTLFKNSIFQVELFKRKSYSIRVGPQSND